MNCYEHPDIAAVAFCRTCGRGVCTACRRDAAGTVFCNEHVPAAASAGVPPPPPRYYASPVSHGVSPPLAFILGVAIPGVGAIYNGQYAKGLVHAIIFGLLISILSGHGAHGLEPLFGILLACWVAYMGLEAYHTAKRRQAGEPVDEFSSIINLRQQSGFPTGAVVLIVLGVVLLLHSLDLIEFDRIVRYWPALLIFVGVSKLLSRTSETPAAPREAENDTR